MSVWIDNILDHGASWVLYGVYQGAIKHTKGRWVYPDHDRTAPELRPTERYVQLPAG